MARLPLVLESEGFQKGLRDVRTGLAGLLGPLNRITASFNILQTGIAGVSAVLGVSFVIASVRAGRALFALNKEMVKAAAAAAEIENRFRIVFGSSADEARESLQQIAIATGRVTNELQEGSARVQQFGVSLGFTRDAMAGVSTELAALAVDFGSFTDRADADVLARFNSALVGNSEAVRELGINLQEEAVRQFAFESGLTETNRQLSVQEKVLGRVGLLFESASDAAFDAIRTQDSLQNIIRRVNSEFRNQQIAVGEGVAEAFRQFLVEGIGVDNILVSIRVSMRLAGAAAEEFFRFVSFGSELLGVMANNSLLLRNAVDSVSDSWGQLVGEARFEALASQIRRLAPGREGIDAVGEMSQRFAQLQGTGMSAAEAFEDVNAQMRALVDTMVQQVEAGERDPFAAWTEAYRRLREERKQDPDFVIASQLKEAREAARELRQEWPVLLTGMRTAFDGFSTALGDAVAGLSDFGDTAQRVFQQMVSDITAAIAKAFLLKTVIGPAFGGLTDTDASFGTLVAQALGFRAAAKGMVEKFALGGFPSGVMNGPVMFGLAGERSGKSEVGFSGQNGRAIAPLEQDPASGALGVRVVGGGGGGLVLNMTNNFGADAQTDDGMRRSGRQLEMQVMGFAQRGGTR